MFLLVLFTLYSMPFLVDLPKIYFLKSVSPIPFPYFPDPFHFIFIYLGTVSPSVHENCFSGGRVFVYLPFHHSVLQQKEGLLSFCPRCALRNSGIAGLGTTAKGMVKRTEEIDLGYVYISYGLTETLGAESLNS